MFLVFPRFRLRISIFALPAALLMLWLEGFVPFFLIFLSASIHEIGHLLALKLCGYNIRRMDILPMGAVIVCPEGIPNRDEVRIALSGPFASIVCAAISSIWFIASDSVDALFLAVINLTLGFFNLMPFKKSDGGKALYCFLADKKTEAEQICFVASVSSKLILIFFAGLLIVISGFNLGVMVLSAALLLQIIF